MNYNKKIIVGVDIHDLRVAKTGQRTILEEFCRQFKQNSDHEIDFIFFDPGFTPYTGRKKINILFEHIRLQVWKQILLPLKAWYHRTDVLFCTDYFVPYIHLGFTTVEIFHDAFFFEYPEHYNKYWLKIFHNIAVPAAKRCSFIVTTSKYALRKIQHYTQISEEKIVSIYPGPKLFDNSNTNIALQDILPGFTKNDRYILHVGVMEKRKNLPALINAFKLLKQSYSGPVKLVLAGKGNGKAFSDDFQQVADTIKKNGLENDVIITGYLPDAQVAVLYQHAYLYVFPSINEGFGLPVIEAFRFGLPVLVANNSCLPEVGGNAVLSFNPYDVHDICNKMKSVLEDEILREELIEKGKQRLAFFSWEKAAAQLIAVFKRASNKSSGN